MIKTNSLHKINSEIEFGFSADEYRMFKYCSNVVFFVILYTKPLCSKFFY